jgi:DNA-directed RNA polymerase subunit RPC12/RpoP
MADLTEAERRADDMRCPGRILLKAKASDNGVDVAVMEVANQDKIMPGLQCPTRLPVIVKRYSAL